MSLKETTAAYKQREGTLDDGEQFACGVDGMAFVFKASNALFLLGYPLFGDCNVEVDFFEFASDSHLFFAQLLKLDS